jgi:Na+-transporting methylmalonyl-CoA/oxaloacetate decarboxylase gamma subunit
MHPGYILLLAGMGTVAVFLLLLMGCTRLSALFFQVFPDRFADPPDPEEPDEAEQLAVALAAAHSLPLSPVTGNAP